MNEWIPIKDKPTIGAEVLFIEDTGEMHIGKFEEDERPEDEIFRYSFLCENESYTTGYSMNFITHWMPLPEPPK